MTNFLVHFYDVTGVGPVTIETPLRGSPALEKAAIATQLRTRFPKLAPSAFVKVGSAIESRGPEDLGQVIIYPGQTVHQLFEFGGQQLTSRRVGKVWFSGAPYDILISFNRGRELVGVSLHPRTKSASTIKFSNQISPQRPATELEEIVKGVLGGDYRELVLNIRNATKADLAPKK